MNAIAGAIPNTLTTPAKKPDIVSVVERGVMLSFIVPIGFVISNIIGYTGGGAHTQGDYVLMLASCMLGLLVAHVPLIFIKVFKMELPAGLRAAFSIFLFGAIFLGEVMSFYYRVPHWDDILHLSSGIMIGLFGSMLVSHFLNGKMKISLPPVAVAVFVFCFAVSVGGIWEIFEFSMDALLGLNMQKTMLQSGEALSGIAAMSDTMIDVIVDSCGALIASLVTYFSLKRKSGIASESVKQAERPALVAEMPEGVRAA